MGNEIRVVTGKDLGALQTRNRATYWECMKWEPLEAYGQVRIMPQSLCDWPQKQHAITTGHPVGHTL